MASSKSRIDTNSLGERGESIFFTRITAMHGPTPLFKPAFLGDKWAVADFAIELVKQPGRFFLVQVKSTKSGMDKQHRLPISVTKQRYLELMGAWIPSYIVGVDDQTEEAYICAAGLRTTGLASLKTQYPLRDPNVRRQLHREVAAFWTSASSGIRPWTSRLY